MSKVSKAIFINLTDLMRKYNLELHVVLTEKETGNVFSQSKHDIGEDGHLRCVHEDIRLNAWKAQRKNGFSEEER